MGNWSSSKLPTLIVTAPPWGKWFTLALAEINQHALQTCQEVFGPQGIRWRQIELTVQRSDRNISSFEIPGIAFATDEDAVEFRMACGDEVNLVLHANQVTVP